MVKEISALAVGALLEDEIVDTLTLEARYVAVVALRSAFVFGGGTHWQPAEIDGGEKLMAEKRSVMMRRVR